MTASPRVIVIRHAPEDVEAAHQIRERLQPLLSQFQVVVGEFDPNLAPAGYVAILTPAFLNERNIESVNSTVHWIPFLYADCEWQRIRFLAAERMLPRPWVPFTGLDPDAQVAVIGELAEACIREFGGDVLEAPLFSPDVQAILKLATVLGLSRESNLTTSCLLFALLERGRMPPTPVDAPQILFSTVSSNRFAKKIEELFPNRANRDASDVSLAWSVNAAAVLDQTRPIAKATTGQTEIHTRHLAASLLLALPGSTEAESLYREMGGDPALARRTLLAFIEDSYPDDGLDSWRKLLLPEDLELSSSLPAYSNDNPLGDDYLGIRKDVRALASLIAAKSVQPPLSIGLFGDWGSGKSFFMQKLKSRVFDIAKAAATVSPADCEFHAHIVQIEFNAWHYMEGELAASLVEHIFSNLHKAKFEKPETLEDRRNQLLKQLFLAKGQTKTAEERIADIQEQITRFQRDANAKTAEIAVQRGTLATIGQNALEKVKRQLSGELSDALAKVPIPPDAEASLDELARYFSTLRSARAQWRIIRDDPSRLKPLLLWITGGAAASASAWIARQWLHNLLSDSQWLFAQITPVLLALSAALKPILQMRFTLATLAKGNRDVDAAIRKVREEAEREAEKINKEIEALEEKAAIAQRELAARNNEIARIQQQLDDLSSGRLFAEFIRERANSADYQKHLGIVARVRRDFEELSNHFRDKSSAPNDPYAIDRIVLYIDDLDRCPPDKVVKVLQMVHLLLAFDLFVVVVAVDSRWVSRALEKEYEWLKDSSEGAKAHDYLEKIFQIPFWLRRLQPNTSKELLRGLAVSPAPTAQKIQTPSTKPVEPAVTQPSTQPEAPKQPPPPPPEPVELAPRSLQLTTDELTAIDRVAPLAARTPRAAKRFLNCYRLIKARMGDGELETFLAGNYEPTLQLLAALTGSPDDAARLIGDLRANAEPNFTGPLAILKTADAGALAAAAETVALYSFQSPWAQNKTASAEAEAAS